MVLGSPGAARDAVRGPCCFGPWPQAGGRFWLLSSPLFSFSLSPPTEFPSCDGALRDFVPGQFPAIVALQKPSRYYKKLMGAMCSVVRWQLAGERVFKWCLFMPFQRKYNETFAVGIDVGHFSEIVLHGCFLASGLWRGDIFVHLKRPCLPWLQLVFLIPVAAHALLYFRCQ